ncbi:MAG: N-6 DNA methylase [Vicinamibacterales bacterium]
MVPGLGGHLVSQSYVELQLLPALLGPGHTNALGEFSRDLSRWWRTVARSIGPASSTRAVFDVAVGPLLSILGHQPPALIPDAWGLAGRVGGADSALVLIVLPWTAGLNERWRDAVRGGLAAGTRWALVSNGHSLRLVDCTRTWTRLSIDFSFPALANDPRGVAALWALARAEVLATATLATIVANSDRQAAQVCRSLGDGVLDALPHLAAALERHPRRLIDGRRAVGKATFEQALTIVYRVLFLLFAEARGLVPVWNEIYRDGYTIDAMCRRISERPGAPGLWDALLAISRMAHAGCRAGDLDVTAFNGRLFSPFHTPLAEGRPVPDAVVRRMVLALATTETRIGRQRIAYHDLGVEQLGAVYERVLEYEPAPATTGLARTSTERKATGSFYTPRAITEFLVRRTLHPLVAGKTADDILALRVVDPSMGSGAFLVAACHYLAEQCEQAMVRDGQLAAAEVSTAEKAAIRRRVAERCLFGVDLNPTAVQLARLSLWLTTLASDRPLTFLDHHLAVGDSLIGARLQDLARSPVARSRQRRLDPQSPVLPMFEDELAGVVATRVLPDRIRLALEPSDTLEAVRQKERRLAALTAPDGPFASWSRAADVWCAVPLWPGPPPSTALAGELMARALGGTTTLPAKQLDAWMARASTIARDRAAFHWEVAFPEVFFDAHGRPRADAGFDAVIGNPPWDMLRADLGSTADRASERLRTSALLTFFRASGIYRSQGTGHPNRYQLFLERALQLTRPGGRLGLILPSGLATDHGSAPLRRLLFDRCDIDTWLGFDNRLSIFPIHRSMRFVLLGAAKGGRTDRLSFRCGLTDAAVLEQYPSGPLEGEARDSIAISRTRLEVWDPEHLTLPEVSTPIALAILTRAAAAAPRLSAADGWAARFGRELNATDDRPHFIPRKTGARTMPIIEGKHLAPFRVSWRQAALAITREKAAALIDGASTFDRMRIAYRDVASATNRVTLIAALLPRGTLSTHTVFCLKTPLALAEQWCLLALLNSLPVNYLVRLGVTTHVTTALMARLPVPRPVRGSAVSRELACLSRSLAKSGVDAAPHLFARLNAIVAGLYGLTREEYAHVVESFPLLPRELRAACLDAQMHDAETRKHRNTEKSNAPS